MFLGSADRRPTASKMFVFRTVLQVASPTVFWSDLDNVWFEVLIAYTLDNVWFEVLIAYTSDNVWFEVLIACTLDNVWFEVLIDYILDNVWFEVLIAYTLDNVYIYIYDIGTEILLLQYNGRNSTQIEALVT